jgi:hypothetical protein
MDNINIADFEVYLNWAVSVLKTQDPQVIQSFKEEANLRLDNNSLNNILVAALHHLADADFEAFRWALHHYDSEFYTELRRRTVTAAARQLIRQGYIPGQDFSSIPVGGLLVTPQAKEMLWKHITPFSEHLLQEVLQPLQPA